MDTNNVLELCLLNNELKLNENDSRYHHYKTIFRERGYHFNNDQIPKKLEDLKRILGSMKAALQSYPPFAYIFINHVYWSTEDEEQGVPKPIRIVLMERDDKDGSYSLLLHLTESNTCYVINHVPINNKDVQDVTNSNVKIHNVFRVLNNNTSSSVIINFELDVLRIVLAILTNNYDEVMRENSESLDCIEGVLTNDELKSQFSASKTLIHRTEGVPVKMMAILNEHVCHYMTQIHHLWNVKGQDNIAYIPLMLLLDSVNKKRCCKTLNYPFFSTTNDKGDSSILRRLIPNDMISTSLSTQLNKHAEMALTPSSIKHPYPFNERYSEYKRVIDDKASILKTMMNNHYVEREIKPFNVTRREKSTTKGSLSSTVIPSLPFESSASGDYDSYYSLDEEDYDEF